MGNLADIVLMLNAECNMHCNHCYVPYAGNRSQKEAVTIIKQLRAKGHKVIVAGAEVLLNPLYLKAYQAAEQNYLLTNGLLLNKTPSLFDELKKHGITDIVLSLHFGIEKKLASVPDRIISGVAREASKRGFNVRMTSMLTPDNYDDVLGMCQKAIDYGAKVLKFNNFVNSGRGKRHDDYALASEQIQAIFAQVIKARKQFNKSQLTINLQGAFGPRAGSAGEKLAAENKYCPAGKSLIAIAPDNTIYGCPFMMEERLAIGRLVDGEIIIEKDLLSGKRDKCIANVV